MSHEQSKPAAPEQRHRHRHRQPRRRLATLASAALTAVLAVGTVGAAATGPASAAEKPWYEATNPLTPDSEVNIAGAPFAGTTPDGEVRGLIDMHTHLMSDEGFGGNIVCGKTFSELGVADALKDCDNHKPDGSLALIENLTNRGGKGPFDKHDPVMWPTFKDTPHSDSMTHQQMYYKWVERAWRGGQRIMVADAVNNNVLCALPTQKNTYSCDDMDTVRRQIKKTKELEAFVDKQFGGPGKGWFRIAYTADEAREYVKQGKLAVILGVEVSNPFGCSLKLGIPQCTKAQIDAGLNELHGLGVRSMFLCHKFDNALCGVRFDEGTQGIIVNLGNFLNTGQWWQTEPCTTSMSDHTIAGGVLPKELQSLAPGAVLPVYPNAPHCNRRGLTNLGEHALRGMMQRGMMVEIDHQSVKAAKRTMEILEAEAYPGVLSSHSWMDKSFTERIYKLGGFITQYGHHVHDFVEEGHAEHGIREKYDVGYGFGMDMNGFGGTPAARQDAATNPLPYPFTTALGATADRQVSGQRVWDYNTDGVAHYGLVPDWVKDMEIDSGAKGKQVVEDLLRGPESYLRTWKASTGYTPGQNLARGMPSAASSTEWSLLGSFKPARANDGSRSTRWASQWKDHQFWQVDLTTPRPVRRVTIDWEKAYAKAYRVQISLDGQEWQTVATQTAGDGGLDSVRLPDGTSARYVRVVADKRATRYGISIYEVGVFS